MLMKFVGIPQGLTLLFLFCEGVAQDHKTAVEWYNQSAEQGHYIAQYN